MDYLLVLMAFLLAFLILKLKTLNQSIQKMHHTLFRMFWYGSKIEELRAKSGGVISVADILLGCDFDIDWCEAAGIKYKEPPSPKARTTK